MSVWRTDANNIRIVLLKKTKQENPFVKTLFFDDKLCRKAVPGQFIMVWVPGLDEIPMSICYTFSQGASISVEKVGPATEALHALRAGELIGVRGPFGNGFRLMKKGSVLIVGGGTGLIPLAFLGEKLAKLGVKITFMAGARTKEKLLFIDKIGLFARKNKGKMIVTTDDGSCGTQCLVTDAAEELLVKEKFDMIYACGPEPMMYKMLLLSEKYDVAFQASLERLMRCAMGICGSCMVGKFRVCLDGPVFSKEQLLTIKDEFGRFKLDFNGKKRKI